MYGGYDQYTNGGYGQPVQHQQQWGQPAHQQVPYGGDNGFNNNYKVGFNAPPAGPPQSYSQQYSDYDQNQQFSANDGHSTGYYGGNSPQPAADEPSSTEDLPYPWYVSSHHLQRYSC